MLLSRLSAPLYTHAAPLLCWGPAPGTAAAAAAVKQLPPSAAGCAVHQLMLLAHTHGCQQHETSLTEQLQSSSTTVLCLHLHLPRNLDTSAPSAMPEKLLPATSYCAHARLQNWFSTSLLLQLSPTNHHHSPAAAVCRTLLHSCLLPAYPPEHPQTGMLGRWCPHTAHQKSNTRDSTARQRT